MLSQDFLFYLIQFFIPSLHHFIRYIKCFFNWKVLNPAAPPQAKEGIKFLGKPLPKILALTPTTVPVLNIVLIPHLEWSPIIKPQNCNPVSLNPLWRNPKASHWHNYFSNWKYWCPRLDYTIHQPLSSR